MGLSRLSNLLLNTKGTLIYVDVNNLDATDSIENKGTSPLRPFKSLQRALIESARLAYQKGRKNDRFAKTTIVVNPGEYSVDNRPGYITDGSNFIRRRGDTVTDFLPFDLTSNFDLTDPNNILYKFNSVYGGVIIPKGTSIVSSDLRKTIIRPTYVPSPTDDNIERSCIFRVTGGCYFWQLTFLDANPNGQAYINYNNNIAVPNFSHHKLACYEYADGVNNVSIDDQFLTYSTDRTDLDIYYEKIGIAYGPASGRLIEPDYPSSIDIEPNVGEYQIVGPLGTLVGISSIRAGDGVTTSNLITVTIDTAIDGLEVDSAFQVQSVSIEYNGQFVVFNKIDDYNIQYIVQNPPTNPLPVVAGAYLSLIPDTVTSSSPYIFNCSLKTAYGLCGILADGDKTSGFKSMVVSQFTGIGLQKDNKAFIKYDETTDTYSDNYPNLFSDSRASYKPAYSGFHIKAINDAYIQIVSTFAIGYANHFITESGGDFSINASNSNFGSKALVASGFKREAFPQDDVGYITHIIPPQEISSTENSIIFSSIDVSSTTSIANSSRLYLYNEKNAIDPPNSTIQGYRIGARPNETINLLSAISGISTQYSSRVVMPNNGITIEEISYAKSYSVGRSSVGINSITGNIITLTRPHSLTNGESIRIISENGSLPVGVLPNTVYYAITTGISSDKVKIAKTLNDALSLDEIPLYGNGGILTIESRVSDKVSGDIGHPIQFDTINNQWYINVSTASTENKIYSALSQFGTGVFGLATPRVFFNRKNDDRNILDKIYRLRYVIPAGIDIPFARPPLDGFIIQESNSTSGITTSAVSALYSPTTVTLSNPSDLRNPRFISYATWSSNTAYYETEIPHNLSVGTQIEILNVKSSLNLTGSKNTGFNGTFIVTEISHSKKFAVSLATDPGSFDLAQTANRTPSLPQFKKKKFKETLYVYRSQQVSEYIPNQQDGVYYLLAINASNSPSVTPFTEHKFSQPIQNLYPQLNRDDPKSDPKESASFALSNPIGQVVINDPQHSQTKESLKRSIPEFGIGIGLTDISSNASGTTHKLYTKYDHGFSGITSVSITSSGVGYGYGTATNLYNAKLSSVSTSKNGSYATARVTVNASGNITSIKIIDGGSSYQIGDTLTVTGIATDPISFTPAVLQVSAIQNPINDSLNIIGVLDKSYEGYNNVYRITAINGPKEIQVASASTISSVSTSGIGLTYAQNSIIVNAGKAISVSSIIYNNVSGIATVSTSNSHGFSLGNKITLGGANSSLFNGDFIVTKSTLSTIEVNVGAYPTSPVTTGTIYAYPRSVTSQGGSVNSSNENLSGRMSYEYVGVSTYISSAVNTTSIDEVQITNASILNLNIGDYIVIDDEILRIKSTVTSNTVKVFRGVFGTTASTHSNGSVVKKIKVNPIELRRNSIIRASAHTFEYIGYGPGNYSTALPLKQDRILSEAEQSLALSTKVDGGITVYTGMDDGGNFYVGNKKVNSTTGSEKVFDAPIPTVTGEDPLGGVSVGFDAINPLEIYVSRSIKIDGGSSGDLISRFNGPVIFNKKIVSNSEEGIQANSIYIQGDSTLGRKYTVGISTPAVSGNPGDLVYNATPTSGGYLGHVYTQSNDWYRVGNISLSKNSNIHIFDSVGIGTTNPRTTFDVEGKARLKSYYQAVQPLSIASNIVTIDLSLAQNFTLTVNSSISKFKIINASPEYTTFTLRITQGATPYGVGINTFVATNGVTAIPVYWANNGAYPTVTQVANKTDVFTFRTFDGCSSFYGQTIGQNFA